MCLPCAESQELPNGDITGKLKANNEIRRDAATAAAANTRDFTQMSTTPLGHT
jgi:hypothetical protein